MTTTTQHIDTNDTTDFPGRPSWLRRAAVAVTGFLAGALPLTWGLGSLLEVVGGTEPEHRFHQLTGQGMLLAFLWLYGVLRVAAAGWHGRRPAPTASLAHLAFVTGTVLCAVFVPGQGVGFVGVVTAVTGALLWLAVPDRPRLRGLYGGPDPLLLPVGMLGAALFTPYVLSQRALQATAHDEHAALTHYFDMAWVCVVVVLLGLVAALVPSARRLAVLAGVSTLVIGSAGLAFTSQTTWSTLAAALGVVAVAAGVVRSRRP
jgi:hypothetical protein